MISQPVKANFYTNRMMSGQQSGDGTESLELYKPQDYTFQEPVSDDNKKPT